MRLLIVIAGVFFIITILNSQANFRNKGSLIPFAATCSLHEKGDANCDSKIDLVDFEIFRKEYTRVLSTNTADFNADSSVTLLDFEIWRRSMFEFVIPTTTIDTSQTPTPTSPITGCTYPAQVLDLTNWKVTLPIGTGSPTEIKQPQISTYTIDPWFKPTSDCNGVQFRAHTSSPVTTSNSSYPRSELREMKNNGVDLADWSNTVGTHIMIIDEAITAVPKGKRHVVAGQIHDANDDVIVIRLEFPKLFIDINGTTGPTLDPAYVLGKRFSVKFIAENGKISIFYNGASTPVYILTKSITKSYFKAGAYTQSNCTRETEYGSVCAADNYGEVVVYSLFVKHE